MTLRKEIGLASPVLRDPIALLRRMTSDLDRVLEVPVGLTRFWPSFLGSESGAAAWAPEIDVFEKEGRLVTRIDLPGLKKEEVKVEVTDGHLAISGERKRESEEQHERFYRRERECGIFYRAVPLPEGAKLEDVNATFSNGVLEVSVPLAVAVESKVRTVEIKEPGKTAKVTA